ncbi:hypothetical protein WN51_02946 [Melipona quadrifasciata]|uniref:Uncharacterized protein n=1 Tax=Melipona quadrifasciata TaxID=166423 RepID=A0A0M9A904_9HYME|nr:hypothetical protein WN51_02946 [Melipona quadrifasciata]
MRTVNLFYRYQFNAKLERKTMHIDENFLNVKIRGSEFKKLFNSNIQSSYLWRQTQDCQSRSFTFYNETK